MKLTGREAIEYAEANGLLLSKYNDPIEDAREGLTPDEARQVASEDPGLIYVFAASAAPRCMWMAKTPKVLPGASGVSDAP